MHRIIFLLLSLVALSPLQGVGAQRDATHTTRSRPRAFFMSLILPGSGEKYCGDTKSATFFMATEAGLLLSAFGFSSYHTWLHEDVLGYAALHADVNTAAVGDNSLFYKALGDWDTMEEYNRYTELSNGAPLYSTQSGFGWTWESATLQDEYRVLRGRMLWAERRYHIVLSSLVINHLVSALNTLRFTKLTKDTTTSMILHTQYHQEQQCMMVLCTKLF